MWWVAWWPGLAPRSHYGGRVLTSFCMWWHLGCTCLVVIRPKKSEDSLRWRADPLCLEYENSVDGKIILGEHVSYLVESELAGVAVAAESGMTFAE